MNKLKFLIILLVFTVLANTSCGGSSNKPEIATKVPRLLIKSDIEKIFEGQVSTLVKKGYPVAMSMTETSFRDRLRKVKNVVAGITNLKEETEGDIPFLIVIPTNMVPSDKQFAMAGVTRNMDLVDNGGFGNQHLVVPDDLYVITNIQDGRGYLQGAEAIACINYLGERNRTGLTAGEGAALATHYPNHLGNHDVGLVGDLAFYGGEIGWFLLLNPGRLSTHKTKQPHNNVGIASRSGEIIK